MNSTIKELAFFKRQITSSLPHRFGPVQCIRNCPDCIIKKDERSNDRLNEHLISIKSFDNLLARKPTWLTQYQSLQYHTGQVDVLRESLSANKSKVVIYVVASNKTDDIQILNSILDYVKLPPVHLIESDYRDCISNLETNCNPLAAIIQLRSCPAAGTVFINRDGRKCLTSKALRDLLRQIIIQFSNEKEFDISVVPVAISKDHERLSFYGIGSICVQILEPYSMRSYLDQVNTDDTATHFTKHLLHDLARNVAILPSHLVAFLLLYLDRENGVTFSELVDYLSWFDKISIHLGMRLGFTGDYKDAVEFGLFILNDFVYRQTDKVYRPKDLDKLADYARLVTPIVAYYGVIGRAILMESNATNHIQTNLSADLKVRVDKNNVLETSKMLAENLEAKIPCRRPCITIERNILDIMEQMQTYFHFITIEEPRKSWTKKYDWEGQSDSDDGYYDKHKENPAFKTWIVLTQREYRLDRINLCINSIESWLA